MMGMQHDGDAGDVEAGDVKAGDVEAVGDRPGKDPSKRWAEQSKVAAPHQ